MKRLLWIGMGMISCAVMYAQQIAVPRIEKMPDFPQPYEMRDWKKVTRGYLDMVFDEGKSGDYFPLSTVNLSGMNYPECNPIYMDTYVGWNSHSKGSEAINVMPAVVSSVLLSGDTQENRMLVKGTLDFFNKRNGENVYLNGFSNKSGNDWWYDIMPNIYFYQLYSLIPAVYAGYEEQFKSVADRWLEAVWKLEGNAFLWRKPNMNYRAFNLISGKPLAGGVKEPEAAGSIAWILYQAYSATGNRDYLNGAQLSLEFLNSLSSNPSYELQLPYGVQVAARMNAVEGCAYDIEKMFNWCFDRGPLRGWGCIVGNWGGYDVSGLIGEANDTGNDYAFAMNGFQQVAALAPAVKYDKRFALAFAKWVLNNANASRLFYRTGLPEQHQEAESYAWSKQYDPQAVIPFESIKEKWEGTSPLAMGDALRGGWAKTNLSLYTGSSVGYLAAVVERTGVEGILQLDLNRTDFGGSESFPTYLYYNPYNESKIINIELPFQTVKVYDAITETWLADGIQENFDLVLPAGEVRMVILIPHGAQVKEKGRLLYAGEKIIDYHYHNNYTPSLRIKNLALQNKVLVKGNTATAVVHLDNATRNVSLKWMLDGQVLQDKVGMMINFPVSDTEGEYTLKVFCEDGVTQVADSIQFRVVAESFSAPVIEELVLDKEMPAPLGTIIQVRAHLKELLTTGELAWEVSAGEIQAIENDSTIQWSLPVQEGIYTIKCAASNLKGKSEKTLDVLVRGWDKTQNVPRLYFPFESSLADRISEGSVAWTGEGDYAYNIDPYSQPLAALELSGGFCHLSGDLNFADALSVGMWIKPEVSNGKEQFVISHGSWQDRYKLSINPDMTLRWTIKTTGGVTDVDYSVPLKLNEYVHVAAVYTGFSSELYINGKLVSYKSQSGKIGTTAEELTLGAMTVGEQGYNFVGCIDEVLLYDVALSPETVSKLPSSGGNRIDREFAENIWFYTEDGSIFPNTSQATIIAVYSSLGMSLKNEGLQTGVYFVQYNFLNQTRVSKVSVRR